jgi:tripartite-type tricarboxylate transporter receptor subunit TctC
MLNPRVLLALLSVGLALGMGGPARANEADSYPNHSIRLIVPYPPGGGGDSTARIIAPPLQEALGQTVIIDNRPGAGASIGTDLAAKAPPDGYTLLETPGAALTVNPQLMKVGYNPKTDLVPINMLTRGVMIFCINNQVPAHNLSEFIAYVKANPGKLNYGSAGNGTITELSWEMLKLATGMDLTHVPYKGSGPAINDLLGGRVQGVVESMLAPYVKSGQMRALAVTGDHRWRGLPDVPTLKEAGVDGVNPSVWFGVLAPKGTPPAIVAKLSAVLTKITLDPALGEKWDGIGMVPVALGPEAFGKVIREDIDTNKVLIEKAHITLD